MCHIGDNFAIYKFYIRGYIPCCHTSSGDECVLPYGNAAQNNSPSPYARAFLMMTGWSVKFLFLDFGYLSLQKLTFGPINTLSSTRTPSQSCTPHFIVTLSPIITSFSIKQCEQILQSRPIFAFGNTTQNCQMLVFSPIFALCTSDKG